MGRSRVFENPSLSSTDVRKLTHRRLAFTDKEYDKMRMLALLYHEMYPSRPIPSIDKLSETYFSTIDVLEDILLDYNMQLIESDGLFIEADAKYDSTIVTIDMNSPRYVKAAMMLFEDSLNDEAMIEFLLEDIAQLAADDREGYEDVIQDKQRLIDILRYSMYKKKEFEPLANIKSIRELGAPEEYIEVLENQKGNLTSMDMFIYFIRSNKDLRIIEEFHNQSGDYGESAHRIYIGNRGDAPINRTIINPNLQQFILGHLLYPKRKYNGLKKDTKTLSVGTLGRYFYRRFKRDRF